MPIVNSLYYFVSGAENRSHPPVVLIHGAGGHHLYWPPQIRRLHHQRMFALDLSGHGRSGGIGHHNIQAYANEVGDFMSAIGLRAAVLAGHSMGGAIALQAAIQFPERLLGLCLIGTGARMRAAPDILQKTADPSTFAAAVALVCDLSFALQTAKRLKELAAVRMAEARPSVLHGDFLACDAFDVREEISDISAPTLILCGAEDRMMPPKYSDYLRAHIVGSRLEIIGNAGHMVMLEQPGAVAERLARFVNGIPYIPGR